MILFVLQQIVWLNRLTSERSLKMLTQLIYLKILIHLFTSGWTLMMLMMLTVMLLLVLVIINITTTERFKVKVSQQQQRRLQ